MTVLGACSSYVPPEPMSTAVFLLTLVLTLLLPAHYLHADPLSSSPLNPAFPMSQRQKTSFYTSGLEYIHLWGPAFGQMGWSTEIFFSFRVAGVEHGEICMFWAGSRHLCARAFVWVRACSHEVRCLGGEACGRERILRIATL